MAKRLRKDERRDLRGPPTTTCTQGEDRRGPLGGRVGQGQEEPSHFSLARMAERGPEVRVSFTYH